MNQDSFLRMQIMQDSGATSFEANLSKMIIVI